MINVVCLQVCPSLLIKKDRGRPTDPKAKPKAYGEVNVAADVPGAELLQIIDDDAEQESSHSDDCGSDNEQEDDQVSLNSDDDNQLGSDNTGSDDDEAEDHDGVSDDENDRSSDYETSGDDADNVEDEGDDLEDSEEDGGISEHEGDGDLHILGSVDTKTTLKDLAKKRKFSDFNDQLTAADSSLRALKKLAGTTMENALPENEDGILSNADFQRIKELKVCSPLIQ